MYMYTTHHPTADELRMGCTGYNKVIIHPRDAVVIANEL